MNYTNFAKTVEFEIYELLKIINNPKISPNVRINANQIAMSSIANAIYAKIYDMNAFDFEIEHTQGVGADNVRINGISRILNDSISNGGESLALSRVQNFIRSNIDKAQNDAFITAKQSGKHPKVERIEIGNCCKWCKGKVGTYYDPDPSVFARHRDCDCIIKTSGYKSRNGLLKNYAKK